MGKVYAVTDESGCMRWQGMSLCNLRGEAQGKQFNPWEKLNGLKGGKEYEVWQFFAENNKEQLAFREIEDFNSLASHARWQLDLGHYEKVKIYRPNFGAKTRVLKAKGMLFMLYGGKIYTKSIKKFNEEGDKDGIR